MGNQYGKDGQGSHTSPAPPAPAASSTQDTPTPDVLPAALPPGGTLATGGGTTRAGDRWGQIYEGANPGGSDGQDISGLRGAGGGTPLDPASYTFTGGGGLRGAAVGSTSPVTGGTRGTVADLPGTSSGQQSAGAGGGPIGVLGAPRRPVVRPTRLNVTPDYNPAGLPKDTTGSLPLASPPSPAESPYQQYRGGFGIGQAKLSPDHPATLHGTSALQRQAAGSSPGLAASNTSLASLSNLRSSGDIPVQPRTVPGLSRHHHYSPHTHHHQHHHGHHHLGSPDQSDTVSICSTASGSGLSTISGAEGSAVPAAVSPSMPFFSRNRRGPARPKEGQEASGGIGGALMVGAAFATAVTVPGASVETPPEAPPTPRTPFLRRLGQGQRQKKKGGKQPATPQMKPKAENKPQPQAQSKPQPQTKPQLKPKPQTQSQTQLKSQPQPKSQSQLPANSNQTTHTQPASKPESQPKSQSQSTTQSQQIQPNLSQSVPKTTPSSAQSQPQAIPHQQRQQQVWTSPSYRQPTTTTTTPPGGVLSEAYPNSYAAARRASTTSVGSRRSSTGSARTTPTLAKRYVPSSPSIRPRDGSHLTSDHAAAAIAALLGDRVEGRSATGYQPVMSTSPAMKALRHTPTLQHKALSVRRASGDEFGSGPFYHSGGSSSSLSSMGKPDGGGAAAPTTGRKPSLEQSQPGATTSTTTTSKGSLDNTPAGQKGPFPQQNSSQQRGRLAVVKTAPGGAEKAAQSQGGCGSEQKEGEGGGVKMDRQQSSEGEARPRPPTRTLSLACDERTGLPSWVKPSEQGIHPAPVIRKTKLPRVAPAGHSLCRELSLDSALMSPDLTSPTGPLSPPGGTTTQVGRRSRAPGLQRAATIDMAEVASKCEDLVTAAQSEKVAVIRRPPKPSSGIPSSNRSSQEVSDTKRNSMEYAARPDRGSQDLGDRKARSRSRKRHSGDMTAAEPEVPSWIRPSEQNSTVTFRTQKPKVIAQRRSRDLSQPCENQQQPSDFSDGVSKDGKLLGAQTRAAQVSASNDQQGKGNEKLTTNDVTNKHGGHVVVAFTEGKAGEDPIDPPQKTDRRWEASQSVQSQNKSIPQGSQHPSQSQVTPLEQQQKQPVAQPPHPSTPSSPPRAAPSAPLVRGAAQGGGATEGGRSAGPRGVQKVEHKTQNVSSSCVDAAESKAGVNGTTVCNTNAKGFHQAQTGTAKSGGTTIINTDLNTGSANTGATITPGGSTQGPDNTQHAGDTPSNLMPDNTNSTAKNKANITQQKPNLPRRGKLQKSASLGYDPNSKKEKVPPSVQNSPGLRGQGVTGPVPGSVDTPRQEGSCVTTTGSQQTKEAQPHSTTPTHAKPHPPPANKTVGHRPQLPASVTHQDNTHKNIVKSVYQPSVKHTPVDKGLSSDGSESGINPLNPVAGGQGYPGGEQVSAGTQGIINPPGVARTGAEKGTGEKGGSPGGGAPINTIQTTPGIKEKASAPVHRQDTAQTVGNTLEGCKPSPGVVQQRSSAPGGVMAGKKSGDRQYHNTDTPTTPAHISSPVPSSQVIMADNGGVHRTGSAPPPLLLDGGGAVAAPGEGERSEEGRGEVARSRGEAHDHRPPDRAMGNSQQHAGGAAPPKHRAAPGSRNTEQHGAGSSSSTSTTTGSVDNGNSTEAGTYQADLQPPTSAKSQQRQQQAGGGVSRSSSVGNKYKDMSSSGGDRVATAECTSPAAGGRNSMQRAAPSPVLSSPSTPITNQAAPVMGQAAPRPPSPTVRKQGGVIRAGPVPVVCLGPVVPDSVQVARVRGRPRPRGQPLVNLWPGQSQPPTPQQSPAQPPSATQPPSAAQPQTPTQPQSAAQPQSQTQSTNQLQAHSQNRPMISPTQPLPASHKATHMKPHSQIHPAHSQPQPPAQSQQSLSRSTPGGGTGAGEVASPGGRIVNQVGAGGVGGVSKGAGGGQHSGVALTDPGIGATKGHPVQQQQAQAVHQKLSQAVQQVKDEQQKVQSSAVQQKPMTAQAKSVTVQQPKAGQQQQSGLVQQEKLAKQAVATVHPPRPQPPSQAPQPPTQPPTQPRKGSVGPGQQGALAPGGPSVVGSRGGQALASSTQEQLKGEAKVQVKGGGSPVGNGGLGKQTTSRAPKHLPIEVVIAGGLQEGAAPSTRPPHPHAPTQPLLEETSPTQTAPQSPAVVSAGRSTATQPSHPTQAVPVAPGGSTGATISTKGSTVSAAAAPVVKSDPPQQPRSNTMSHPTQSVTPVADSTTPPPLTAKSPPVKPPPVQGTTPTSTLPVATTCTRPLPPGGAALGATVSGVPAAASLSQDMEEGGSVSQAAASGGFTLTPALTAPSLEEGCKNTAASALVGAQETCGRQQEVRLGQQVRGSGGAAQGGAGAAQGEEHLAPVGGERLQQQGLLPTAVTEESQPQSQPGVNMGLGLSTDTEGGAPLSPRGPAYLLTPGMEGGEDILGSAVRLQYHSPVMSRTGMPVLKHDSTGQDVPQTGQPVPSVQTIPQTGYNVPLPGAVAPQTGLVTHGQAGVMHNYPGSAANGKPGQRMPEVGQGTSQVGQMSLQRGQMSPLRGQMSPPQQGQVAQQVGQPQLGPITPQQQRLIQQMSPTSTQSYYTSQHQPPPVGPSVITTGSAAPPTAPFSPTGAPPACNSPQENAPIAHSPVVSKVLPLPKKALMVNNWDQKILGATTGDLAKATGDNPGFTPSRLSDTTIKIHGAGSNSNDPQLTPWLSDTTTDSYSPGLLTVRCDSIDSAGLSSLEYLSEGEPTSLDIDTLVLENLEGATSTTYLSQDQASWLQAPASPLIVKPGEVAGSGGGSGSGSSTRSSIYSTPVQSPGGIENVGSRGEVGLRPGRPVVPNLHNVNTPIAPPGHLHTSHTDVPAAAQVTQVKVKDSVEVAEGAEQLVVKEQEDTDRCANNAKTSSHQVRKMPTEHPLPPLPPLQQQQQQQQQVGSTVHSVGSGGPAPHTHHHHGGNTRRFITRSDTSGSSQPPSPSISSSGYASGAASTAAPPAPTLAPCVGEAAEAHRETTGEQPQPANSSTVTVIDTPAPPTLRHDLAGDVMQHDVDYDVPKHDVTDAVTKHDIDNAVIKNNVPYDVTNVTAHDFITCDFIDADTTSDRNDVTTMHAHTEVPCDMHRDAAERFNLSELSSSNEDYDSADYYDFDEDEEDNIDSQPQPQKVDQSRDNKQGKVLESPSLAEGDDFELSDTEEDILDSDINNSAVCDVPKVKTDQDLELETTPELSVSSKDVCDEKEVQSHEAEMSEDEEEEKREDELVSSDESEQEEPYIIGDKVDSEQLRDKPSEEEELQSGEERVVGSEEESSTEQLTAKAASADGEEDRGKHGTNDSDNKHTSPASTPLAPGQLDKAICQPPPDTSPISSTAASPAPGIKLRDEVVEKVKIKEDIKSKVQEEEEDWVSAETVQSAFKFRERPRPMLVASEPEGDQEEEKTKKKKKGKHKKKEEKKKEKKKRKKETKKKKGESNNVSSVKESTEMASESIQKVSCDTEVQKQEVTSPQVAVTSLADIGTDAGPLPALETSPIVVDITDQKSPSLWCQSSVGVGSGSAATQEEPEVVQDMAKFKETGVGESVYEEVDGEDGGLSSVITIEPHYGGGSASPPLPEEYHHYHQAAWWWWPATLTSRRSVGTQFPERMSVGIGVCPAAQGPEKHDVGLTAALDVKAGSDTDSDLELSLDEDYGSESSWEEWCDDEGSDTNGLGTAERAERRRLRTHRSRSRCRAAAVEAGLVHDKSEVFKEGGLPGERPRRRRWKVDVRAMGGGVVRSSNYGPGPP